MWFWIWNFHFFASYFSGMLLLGNPIVKSRKRITVTFWRIASRNCYFKPGKKFSVRDSTNLSRLKPVFRTTPRLEGHLKVSYHLKQSQCETFQTMMKIAQFGLSRYTCNLSEKKLSNSSLNEQFCGLIKTIRALFDNHTKTEEFRQNRNWKTLHF